MPGCLQQPPRPVDEVVEVGDARGALGRCVGAGERLPGPQARGHVCSKPRAALDAEQLADQRRKPARMRFIMRFGLGWPA